MAHKKMSYTRLEDAIEDEINSLPGIAKKLHKADPKIKIEENQLLIHRNLQVLLKVVGNPIPHDHGINSSGLYQSAQIIVAFCQTVTHILENRILYPFFLEKRENHFSAC